jgi:integrase
MRSVRWLREFFDGYKAIDITTKEIQKYIKQRQEAGRANATINRELAALKRMFNLGFQHHPPLVKQPPHITMLEENNVREGFFTKEEFHRLMKVLPLFLQPVVHLGWKTGMRKEEILSLEWKQVDLRENMLRLTDTKTKEPRNIPLTGPLPRLIEWLRQKKLKEGSKLPYVFLNRDGNDRIKDFRKTWETACRKANLGKRLFHDLRRSAVRNMIRAGVPEKTAMMISGHKTRSVFDRYNIVDEKDLTKAMQKTDAYLRGIDEPSRVVPMKRRLLRKPKLIKDRR